MTQHKSQPPTSARVCSSVRDWLSAIGAVLQAITGICALYLAWQAFSIDTNEPELEISSPNVLRLEFSKQYMNVFAQPTFIVKNPTKKVVIVKKMCMNIQHSESTIGTYKTFEEACSMDNGNPIMTLGWTHIAKFNWDTERDISFYEEWMSDALPLPVSISNPQTPVAAFWGNPENMKKWEPERCYRATIYALNSSNKILGTSFYFKLTKQNLEGLNKYSTTIPFYGQHVTLDVLPTNCSGAS